MILKLRETGVAVSHPESGAAGWHLAVWREVGTPRFGGCQESLKDRFDGPSPRFDQAEDPRFEVADGLDLFPLDTITSSTCGDST